MLKNLNISYSDVFNEEGTLIHDRDLMSLMPYLRDGSPIVNRDLIVE
jgi:hypothetical protein